MKKGTLLSSW